MSGRSHSLNQRGDTLVEVLIAMAIVAVVLGGAYASANNSLKSTQAAKERDVALRVAEAQIERVRGFKNTSPNAPIAGNSCLTSALAVVGNGGALPPLDTDVLRGASGVYNAACVTTSTGVTYSAAINDIPYHVYNEVSGNSYTVHVRWARVGGGQNQEIILRYRYY